MSRFSVYLRDEHGASTVEFVLVLPILLLIVFGMLQFGMLLYTSAQLHWTAEESARCASVRLDCHVGGVATGAVTSATVTAFANGRYKGLSPATFTYANTGTCSKDPSTGTNNGKRVVGTGTYNFNVGVFYRSIPLSATACFP
jgi:Flp pilus assembly protein TadG